MSFCDAHIYTDPSTFGTYLLNFPCTVFVHRSAAPDDHDGVLCIWEGDFCNPITEITSVEKWIA